MKRTGILAVVLWLWCCSALWGCGQQEEQLQETAESVEIKTEEEPETYTFRDVEGKAYEAELLEIPLLSWDLSRITEEDGKKYYRNAQGQTVSRLGIDVSEYQQEVDWQQVKDFGVDYVMVRLGYRGYGESGTLVEDAMFREHTEQALDAGLEVGVYFFSQAVTQEEAREEAQFVLDRVREFSITGPVVYDTEEIKFDTSRTDHLSGTEVTDHCLTFCSAVQEARYEPMIYANMKWMAYTLELERLTEYAMWYADYESLPQCPYEIAMWQYTETGQVPGIPGNVDMNLWIDENPD